MDIFMMIQETIQKLFVVGGIAGAYAFYRHLCRPTLEASARDQQRIESWEKWGDKQRNSQPLYMKRIPYDRDETPQDEW